MGPAALLRRWRAEFIIAWRGCRQDGQVHLVEAQQGIHAAAQTEYEKKEPWLTVKENARQVRKACPVPVVESRRGPSERGKSYAMLNAKELSTPTCMSSTWSAMAGSCCTGDRANKHQGEQNAND
jgi:hypothetical protein